MKEQTAKLLGRESPKLDLYQPWATCPFHPGRESPFTCVCQIVAPGLETEVGQLGCVYEHCKFY